MEWKNNFSVGLPDIDEQHKRLIAIINKLHDTMKTGAAHAQLIRVMEELVGYTQEHFAYEERLLAAAKYPGLDEHIRKHTSMKAQVGVYCRMVQNDKATTPLQLMEFLKKWLGHHILNTDMDYSRCVRAMTERNSSQEQPISR